MTTLTWILAASFVGGLLSIACAGLISLTLNPRWVPMLVSYAVGALLGAVFLDVLPQALELSKDYESVGLALLAGIFAFFVLEKLVLWRHCHTEDCEVHDAYQGHDHGRSGMLIMVGDTFHNFVDGIIIAAAFLADVKVGLVTAVAIVAHEIPQEVGDFLILIHSGYSRARAFTMNIVSSLATVVGGLLGYYALKPLSAQIPILLAVAAASMLYVAMSDLIPGLHRRTNLGASVQQVLLIALGVGSIVLAHALVGHQ